MDPICNLCKAIMAEENEKVWKMLEGVGGRFPQQAYRPAPLHIHAFIKGTGTSYYQNFNKF